MAASRNKEKIVKQAESPSGKSIPSNNNPLAYRTEHPAWNFAASDVLYWPFSQEAVNFFFWTEILPFMKSLEALTWQEILNYSNNKHHLITRTLQGLHPRIHQVLSVEGAKVLEK